jgi:hypothetical protein
MNPICDDRTLVYVEWTCRLCDTRCQESYRPTYQSVTLICHVCLLPFHEEAQDEEASPRA